MSRDHEVAILGAGPAGLAAAWKLARAGHAVTVFERNNFVGGLTASFDVAGLRVDHGSHRLHPNTDPAMLRDLQALLGDDLQLRPRHGRIRMAGTFVPFPPSPLSLARNLPRSVSAKLARDVVTNAARRPRRDTFAEVVRASLGPTMLDEFYAPLIEKLFGEPATALHGDLARRRVSARRGRDLVRKTMRREAQGNVFWYPRRGYGQIADALADAAVAAGARIELATTIDRIDFGERVSLIAADRSFDASMVMSTLPLPRLAGLAGGPRRDLRFRAMTLVYLVLDQPRWTEFDAHYLVPSDVPITRISEPRNYRTSVDDPTDRTVLCAEWPGFVDDDVWRAAPDHLADRIRESLAAHDLAIPAPVAVEVRRTASAYPVYDLDYAAPLNALVEWIDGVAPQLVSFGRNGSFAHDNAHHAMAMGYEAAACLAPSGEFDVERWQRARATFASHVVED